MGLKLPLPEYSGPAHAGSPRHNDSQVESTKSGLINAGIQIRINSTYISKSTGTKGIIYLHEADDNMRNNF
jgi:hypothetical protein